MRVRLTGQISGTRDGQNWPEPGTIVDLPDTEARGLIAGNSAVKVDGEAAGGKVLVPPDGIHTPGRLAQAASENMQLVEVPVDAVADPQGTVDAVQARADGDYVEVPRGTGVQGRKGEALTQSVVEENAEAEKVTREDYYGSTGPKVGEKTTAPDKSTSDKKTASK